MFTGRIQPLQGRLNLIEPLPGFQHEQAKDLASYRDRGVDRFDGQSTVPIGRGRVIKGWDQGLIGMKVGGKRKLRVPAHLAYGERQIGALIKPNSNLVFDIELLEVLTRDD